MKLSSVGDHILKTILPLPLSHPNSIKFKFFFYLFSYPNKVSKPTNDRKITKKKKGYRNYIFINQTFDNPIENVSETEIQRKKTYNWKRK